MIKILLIIYDNVLFVFTPRDNTLALMKAFFNKSLALRMSLTYTAAWIIPYMSDNGSIISQSNN